MRTKKGFSYVEMLIVISIMMIVVGLFALSMTLISRTNVSKAADNAISAINQARSIAYTQGSEKGTIYFVTYKGAIYYAIGEDPRTDPLNDSSIDPDGLTKIASPAIKISVNGDPNSSLGTYGVSRAFSFKQSTGGLKKLAGEVESGDCHIYFKYGNKSSKITIDRVTGKCTKE